MCNLRNVGDILQYRNALLRTHRTVMSPTHISYLISENMYATGKGNISYHAYKTVTFHKMCALQVSHCYRHIIYAALFVLRYMTITSAGLAATKTCVCSDNGVNALNIWCGQILVLVVN